MDVCRHQANTKRKGREIMNNLGIDVGKKKCRAALKDERGEIVSEFFFSNNTEGISTLHLSKLHPRMESVQQY